MIENRHLRKAPGVPTKHRFRRGRCLFFVVLVTGLATAPRLATAVILAGSGDPAFHTQAPTGDYSGSGWDYVSSGGKLGVPISNHHFITAKHTGGSIGSTFVYQGISYQTTGYYDAVNSDLRIWEVDAAFPNFAPIYQGSDEIGKESVVFGRGTQRGDPVYEGETLTGWEWGSPDGQLRWGVNTIENVVEVGGNLGHLLQMRFDNNSDPNEAHLSTGDSGGPVFLREAGVWKLAGINYGVDGPARTATFGSNFYATRISSAENAEWINSIITPVPEPSTWSGATAILLATWIAGRRLRERQDNR